MHKAVQQKVLSDTSSPCIQTRAAPGALLDTWLPRERSKAKRIEQTEVRMCQSTQLIWHINWVKRQ